MKVYYFKAPNFTYSLLVPISLFIAFTFAGQVDSTIIISGLTSLVILFGTMSIEAVGVVLERQTGTFDRLLAAPVSLFTIVLGKSLAGFFYGVMLAIIIMIPLTLLSGATVAYPFSCFISIALSSMTFSIMGVAVSAHAKWVPEAQMLSNFIRFPMAFLSGTFISFELIPLQLSVVARFLPLTYAIEALRISMKGPVNISLFLLDLLVLALFSMAFLVVASRMLQRKIE